MIAVAWSHGSYYGTESWDAELDDDDTFASATHHALDSDWQWQVQGFRSDPNIADVLAFGRAPTADEAKAALVAALATVR